MSKYVPNLSLKFQLKCYIHFAIGLDIKEMMLIQAESDIQRCISGKKNYQLTSQKQKSPSSPKFMPRLYFDY